MRVDRTGAGRRRTGAALLLAVGLALTGCSGGGDSGGAKEAAADRAAPSGAPGKADQSAGDRKQQAELPGVHIIRTAELSVKVENVDRALSKIHSVAEGAGGFVADETMDDPGGGGASGTVVVRVPQEEFAAVLRELEGAGRLTYRSVKAKDVTEQVVDVESRVTSQRASVARVRELMDRATTLSDVVVLEGELSSRQAELESLLSRQASLKDRTTMSTITLNIDQPSRKEKPAEKDGTGFGDALRGGWDVLVTIVRGIGLAIAATAPFLAIAAVAYVIWRLVRSRRPAAPAPVDVPAPSPEPDPAPVPEPRPLPRHPGEHE